MAVCGLALPAEAQIVREAPVPRVEITTLAPVAVQQGGPQPLRTTAYIPRTQDSTAVPPVPLQGQQPSPIQPAGLPPQASNPRGQESVFPQPQPVVPQQPAVQPPNQTTANAGGANGALLQSRADDAADANAAAQIADSQSAESLGLADVIASVYQSYPVILAARQERPLANGQLVEAYGAYDTKLQGYSLSEPTGFYRNFRHGLGVARQTWWGGYVAAGYRVGRGDIQPWYKERETNEGGEFKLALAQPLLQGRAIDPQRLAVFQASLANRAADPLVLQAVLDTSHEAAIAYWKWVAAGAMLETQRELLALSVERGRQFEADFQATRRAEVDLVFNNMLIAERIAKKLDSEQKFQAAAVKLSMFLRNENGQRIVPGDEWLPRHFPEIASMAPGDFNSDLASAMQRRPEPLLLQLELRSVQLDRQLANNNLLPRIDAIAEASQDVGTPASSKNDKGQFELLVGVQGEVPIQRRKAFGKIQSTTAKIEMVSQKLRFTQDKIAAELTRARFALDQSEQIVAQAEVALKASLDTLSRYEFAFEIGKTDLFYINALEIKVNETELKLVEAQQNWFIALADMQAALGLNPLDQAMEISQLPESKRPAPGFLPQPAPQPAQKLEQDWELHIHPVLPNAP